MEKFRGTHSKIKLQFVKTMRKGLVVIWDGVIGVRPCQTVPEINFFEIKVAICC